MISDPNATPASELLFQVERLYASLSQSVLPDDADSEPSLGGRLLYTGELAPSRALLVAANIAGAASLATTADAAAQKQGIRDGVIDFLVNSLDEALRILKNEIRKRQPVAVCISLAPEAVEREMEERGVLPDLFASKIAPSPQPEFLLLCSAAQAPALWLPKLDAIVLASIEANQPASLGAPGPSHLGTRESTQPNEAIIAGRWQTRWLRLAPRYLGRLSQGQRLYPISEAAAASFIAAVKQKVETKEIATAIDISIIRKSRAEQHTLTPPQS
jgi:hypothetical protein